jgi:hypothetical protein
MDRQLLSLIAICEQIAASADQLRAQAEDILGSVNADRPDMAKYDAMPLEIRHADLMKLQGQPMSRKPTNEEVDLLIRKKSYDKFLDDAIIEHTPFILTHIGSLGTLQAYATNLVNGIIYNGGEEE